MADDSLLESVVKLQRKLQAVGPHSIEKVEYVSKALSKLSRVPMTLDVLQRTHVGKDVNQFRKWAEPVGDKAKSLVKKWKQLLPTSEVLPPVPRPTSEVLVSPASRPISDEPAMRAAQAPSEVKLTLAQYQAKRHRTEPSTSDGRSQSLPAPPTPASSTGEPRKRKKHKRCAIEDGEASCLVSLGDGLTFGGRVASSVGSNDVAKGLTDGDSEVDYLAPFVSESPPKKRHKSHHHRQSHSSSKHSELSEMKELTPCKQDDLSSKMVVPSSREWSITSSSASASEPPPEALPETSSVESQSPAQATARSKRKANFESGLDAVALTKRSRTMVYSGKKSISGPQTVTSLFDLSMKILMDNIDAIEEVGGVPYLILEPLLQKCTATQLMRLEEYNPHFLEDSDVLWEKHCKKEFKSALKKRSQTWRELYIDKLAEREQRLRNLTANIKAKEEKRKEPQRSAKQTLATRVPTKRGQRWFAGGRPSAMKPFDRPAPSKSSLMSKTMKMAKERNVIMRSRPGGK